MADPLNISRYDKSLGVLTCRFVALLRSSPNGILDLKSAAEILAVSQKRRIYDITNVLEGIGLIEKKNKNLVKWKGTTSIVSQNLPYNIDSLKDEIAYMKKYEHTLETHIKRCQQSVKNILEDEKNISKCYILASDMDKCFEDHIFLAIKAPLGTILEVPVVNYNEGKCKPKYKVHLKSASDPVDVFYFQEGSKLKDVRNLNSMVNENYPELEEIADTTVKNHSENKSNSQTKNVPDDILEASIVLGDLYKDIAFSNMETDSIEDFYNNDIFSPLLRLSPPPNSRDYSFNLADSEGISDLFDLPPVVK